MPAGIADSELGRGAMDISPHRMCRVGTLKPEPKPSPLGKCDVQYLDTMTKFRLRCSLSSSTGPWAAPLYLGKGFFARFSQVKHELLEALGRKGRTALVSTIPPPSMGGAKC